MTSATINARGARLIARPLEPSRTATVAAVLSAMAIPLVLAIAFLPQSLRLDEAQSLWQASRPALAILSIVAGDVHVPLYHLVLHAWLLYMGDTVASARILSLLFFMLSIPLLYLLGERVYGRRVALFAVFVFAISPFMNWYANEIRMYTMLVFFTLANQYFFVRLFSDERPREGVWALYALTAILGAFTHYFFFLNLLAQAAYYFARRELFPEGALRRFMLTALVLGIAFIPWIWYVAAQGVAGFETPVLARPSSVNLFGAFSEFFFGFQSDTLNTIVLSLWPVAIILAFLGLRRRRLAHATEYFTLSVVLPFALAFLISFVITPVFVSRYLIFTIPALYLAVAALFASYPARFGTFARATLVLLVLMTLVIEIANPRAPVKEDYVDAVAYMSAHATPQDAILLSAPFTVYPVEYYYRGSAAISTLPAWDQFAHGAIPPFDPGQLPQEVAAATAGDQNVYLLLSYDQGYEKQVHDYFESHYKRLYTQQYSNDLTLYVYRLRYDTEKSAIAAQF